MPPVEYLDKVRDEKNGVTEEYAVRRNLNNHRVLIRRGAGSGEEWVDVATFFHKGDADEVCDRLNDWLDRTAGAA